MTTAEKDNRIKFMDEDESSSSSSSEEDDTSETNNAQKGKQYKNEKKILMNKTQK